MSIDGLLTFIGLIVALLALATDARRSALMLRPGATLLATVIFGLAVLYLELFEVVAPTCAWRAEVCRVLVLGETRWIAPQQAAFVLVMVWLILIVLNLRRTKLMPRHMPRLLRLATDLADEKRYSEVCRVTQPHLKLIARTAGGGMVKATTDQMEAASTLQRLVYRRPELIRFIALERPAMATQMMAVESQIVFDFTDRLLTILIANTDSPLFTEVFENQNIFSTGYDFPDHNTYLRFLFGDVRNANRLAAWRPVMEHTLTSLGDARDQPYQTFLNSPAERFEETCWRDPTFVAIRYLDLMVDAAMRQRVEWHMWLFYAPHLTRKLLELYDDPRLDEEVFAEWPTRNAYLLYTLFDAMTDWIQAVNDLPDDSPHLGLKSIRATHQNGNIPKSAIIALGDCLRQVLLSDEVSDAFKATLCDLVFSALDKLPDTGARAGFRASLIASLISGGPLLMSDHLPRLYGAFSDLDHVLRHRLQDAQTAMEAALKMRKAGRPGAHPSLAT